MGCSSNKDAKDPGSIKSAKTTAFEIKCKICYTNFDRQQAQPMVIPCGHTLCKNCLNHMPKAECPYDRVKFDKTKCQKNYQILGMLDEQGLEGIRVIEQEFTQKILCNKKHKTQWSGIEQLCSLCHQNGPGFKCQKCAYNRCDRCVKRKPTRMCYNGHKTKWIGNKFRCVKCRQNACGWQCIECQYSYCHICSKTEVQKGFCPNGHTTLWNPILSQKSSCLQCGQMKCGFACEQCKFIICKKCAKYEFTSTKCPNNHSTLWLPNPKGSNGNLKCQNCNIQSHGYSCEACCFLMCTECSKWKFQFTSTGSSLCPNNHQTKWIAKLKSCSNKCRRPQSSDVDGFICSVEGCCFELCRPCSKLKPVTRSCFNQHITTWNKEDGECINCSKKMSGWRCKQCQSYFCSSCTQTTLLGGFCPNSHKKIWKSISLKCQVCAVQTHGWQCEKCDIFTCSLCQKTDLSKDCPNRHQTFLSKDDIQCIICSETKPGWNCRQCSYKGCLDCIKGKINSVSCPYYHAVKIISHQEGIQCKRCKQSFQTYKTCESRCIILCQACILRK